MSHQTTELAVKPTTSIVTAQDFMPIMAIEQAVERYKIVVDFVKRVMVEGRDYGTIPGTERKAKPGENPTNKTDTLLKPGAEKLCTLFGLVPDYQEIRCIEDFDKGLFFYVYRCVLTRHGEIVGSGIASANSREKKHLRPARLCPDCNQPTIKRSKPRHGDDPNVPPGWYCFDKIGGCGMNFAADDARIKESAIVDPNAAADLVNTLMKMGQKRALVGATLIATNVSDLFTQDVDDAPFVEESHPPTPEPTYVLTENGDPDLSHFQTFLVEVGRIARSRNVPDSAIRGFLSAGAKKGGFQLPETDAAWRADKLKKFAAGEFDRWLTEGGNATPTPPPTPPAPQGKDPLEDSATFLVACECAAESTGVDPATYDKAIPALKKIVRRADRERTLNAIKDKAFDWALAVPKTN